MVIILTLVISALMLITGVTVAFVEIRDPEADTSTAADFLFTIVTVVLGSLMGLLAGKNEKLNQLTERPDKTKDDITETGLPQ
ncbi:MAG: hypothetical protein ABWY25_05740 [Paenisporosarcina sp.]